MGDVREEVPKAKHVSTGVQGVPGRGVQSGLILFWVADTLVAEVRICM